MAEIKRITAGDRFGYFTVLGEAGKRPGRNMKYWLCRCDCGSVKAMRFDHIKYGLVKSCGCMSAALIAKARTTHGNNKRGRTTKEYRVWQHMLARCHRPTVPSYKYYGPKGISVCERWLDFANFLADMGPSPYGTSLDRINPDGDYEPRNCRWATARQQSRNRKIITSVKFRGVVGLIPDVALKTGVTETLLYCRRRRLRIAGRLGDAPHDLGD